MSKETPNKETPKKIKLNANVLTLILAIITIVSVVGLTSVLLIASGSSDAAEAENRKMKNQIEELEERLEEEQKIDVTYIGNKLETISELATAKMTYNGIIHFSEGSIPLITKKEFYMAYRAEIKAGVDLSQAAINVTDKTVTITLPPVTLYEPVVYEDSFQFFDKSTALFNPEKMDDLAQAITAAKEDLLAQPETENMKQTAKEQTQNLITALFEGLIGDRELVITYR